jgi:hypothetical protein
MKLMRTLITLMDFLRLTEDRGFEAASLRQF